MFIEIKIDSSKAKKNSKNSKEILIVSLKIIVISLRQNAFKLLERVWDKYDGVHLAQCSLWLCCMPHLVVGRFLNYSGWSFSPICSSALQWCRHPQNLLKLKWTVSMEIRHLPNFPLSNTVFHATRPCRWSKHKMRLESPTRSAKGASNTAYTVLE